MRGSFQRFPAIVLAGERNGVADPLAAEHGVAHKFLVPIAGEPLVAHVLRALADCSEVSCVYVSTQAPAALESIPVAAELRASGRLCVLPARPNLVDSVLAAAEKAGCPALVTTADNVLLTPEGTHAFVRGATRAGADVAIALARKRDVLAAHPRGQLRFYEFADDAYSNCNLFWFGAERGLAASESFREGGQFAKHPRRILRAFGALNLIAFRFRLRSLGATTRALSRRFGVGIEAVVLEDGALAIDVDNARTRDVAEALLTARAKGMTPA